MSNWLKVLIVLVWFILTFAIYRGLVPYLMTQPDTISVVIGIVIAFAWVVLTLWSLDRYEKTLNKSKE